MSWEGVANVAEKTGEGLSKIFSPARIAYGGFLVVCYAVLHSGNTDRFRDFLPSRGQFLMISGLFLLLDIFHNDYLRPLLNATAERHGLKGYAITFGAFLSLIVVLLCVLWRSFSSRPTIQKIARQCSRAF